MTLGRYALLPVALLQYVVPALPALGFGDTIGDRAREAGIPPELPLGIFFSIWGVIFSTYLAVAIWALVKPSHVYDRVGGPLALAGLGFNGAGRRFLICVCVGLLAGWLSVAVSISVPEVMRDVLGRGPTDHPWHSLWATLIPAAVLAFIFARYVSASLWYFVALSWGLLGLLANNWARTEMHFLAIAVGVVGLLVLRLRLQMGLEKQTA